MGMLEGNVAICTGAGRGVGAEVAKLMAKNGAKILLTMVRWSIPHRADGIPVR